MAMTEADTELVVNSIPLIRERLVPASTLFYENLFEIAPEMRDLFRSDLTGQGMRFMTTLATIADLLRDPEALGAELEDLGKAHAGLGIKAEHFAKMRSALMVTLGETIGPDFTQRLQDAWNAAFDTISSEMVARGHIA